MISSSFTTISGISTLSDSCPDEAFLASPTLSAATLRVRDYLVRSGWGTQPATQRAERLISQVIEREGANVGDPQHSPSDACRVARMSIAMICQSQTEQIATSVIRPVLNGSMRHPMTVRPVGPLRRQWWIDQTANCLRTVVAICGKPFARTMRAR